MGSFFWLHPTVDLKVCLKFVHVALSAQNVNSTQSNGRHQLCSRSDHWAISPLLSSSFTCDCLSLELEHLNVYCLDSGRMPPVHNYAANLPTIMYLILMYSNSSYFQNYVAVFQTFDWLSLPLWIGNLEFHGCILSAGPLWGSKTRDADMWILMSRSKSNKPGGAFSCKLENQSFFLPLMLILELSLSIIFY